MRTLVAFRSWRSLTPVLAVLLALTVPSVAQGAGKTAKSVGAGWQHSCAVRSDGTAWCWGSNVHGELGNGGAGGSATSSVPVQVHAAGGDPLKGVSAIDGGREHSCALLTDKTVWCWGEAAEGEVGDGTQGDGSGLRLEAVQVQRGAGALTDVVAMSAGTEFTCAVRGDGSAWCWGSDYYGQLGDGTTGDSNLQRLSPVQVVGDAGPLADITAISAGDAHACARRSDGTAWCWGFGFSGELGNGATPHYLTHAVQVLRGAGAFTRVRAISAGNGHTCAVRTDGTAWCWGANNYGQLGDGTTTARTTPVQVRKGSGKLTGVRSISATSGYTSAGFTCAVLSDATAWCWGYDGAGELGDGTTGGPLHWRAKPVQVVQGAGKLTGVRSLSTGGTFACAVKTAGTAWCWGEDDLGETGDGGPVNIDVVHLKPVRVHLPT